MEQYVRLILIVPEAASAKQIALVVKFANVAQPQVFAVMVSIGVPQAKYMMVQAVFWFLQLITVV
ncbi:unnamed protein product, partial [marine sediment metagenome]